MSAARSTAVKGAAAGAVAVWAMDVTTWFLYRRQPAATLEREAVARVWGLDAAHALAHRAARLFGRTEVPPQPNAAGIATHAGMQMVKGAIYARLRQRYPVVRAGRGAMWGLGVFLVVDEAAARVVGVSGPLRAYPWQAHARGLVGHLVLGVAMEATLDALDA